MKTLKKVDVSFLKVEYLPDLEEMKERVIYISDKYGTSGHKCLCGCGQLTILPLEKGEWSYEVDAKNRISFSPSVGNYQLLCASHYIITKGTANFV